MWRCKQAEDFSCSLPRDVISIRKRWKLKLWQVALTHGNANIYLLITCRDNARHHRSQHEDTCLHSFYIHSITFLATLPYLGFQHTPYIPAVKCAAHLFKHNWAAQLHFPCRSWTKPKSYLKWLFWKVSISHPLRESFPFSVHKEFHCSLELVFPPTRETQCYTQSVKPGNLAEKSTHARLLVCYPLFYW